MNCKYIDTAKTSIGLNAAFKALIDMGNQQGDEAHETLNRSTFARDGRLEVNFDAEFVKIVLKSNGK